jgi:hypothetical protein
MTALVVVGILILVGVVALAVWVGFLRTVRAGALAEVVKVQQRLILDIEEKAMNYGYADPLAYDIIQTIREVRKKENSK